MSSDDLPGGLSVTSRHKTLGWGTQTDAERASIGAAAIETRYTDMLVFCQHSAAGLDRDMEWTLASLSAPLPSAG